MKFINWERKGNFNLSEQMEYNACNCCSHRTDIYIWVHYRKKLPVCVFICLSIYIKAKYVNNAAIVQLLIHVLF